MSFHKKNLLLFVIFHLVFTVGVLVVEYLLAASGAYDDYRIHYSLVFILQIILMTTLSVALIALAYVSRFAWLHISRRRQRVTTG
jgi:hypothetical protein